jgi:hypothetical protein
MVCRSKEYKKTIQKQFNEFQKSFVNKLRGLRTSDPKAYWSLLNKGCDKSKIVTQKVAMNVFFNHFKELYTNIPALSAADLIILLQSFTILLTVTILVF